MNNTNTPTREIVALVGDNDRGWSPTLELDPATVSVDSEGMADPFEEKLLMFLSSVFDLARINGCDSMPVVWSDTGLKVRALCASCDDVFDVEDGVLIIIRDDGVVVCSDCESADDDAIDEEIEFGE